MQLRRSHLKLLALAVSCLALGAGISAIASAGAATGSPHARSAHAATHRGHPALRRSALRRMLHRAVHGDLTIPTAAGLVTVSFDRGTVVSVSGQQLTLREGTAAAQKTVTLTIPSAARVRVDRSAATLASVKPGQRAIVLTLPKRTLVIARTP